MGAKIIYKSKANQTNVDYLHNESLKLKSHLMFMYDEIVFLSKLLNSYIFEPNTPNLFERLQEFLYQIKKQKITRKKVYAKLEQHENDLGGLLECTCGTCNQEYISKHDLMKAEAVACLEDFKNLKSEIFLYASKVLHRRKPC